jgi:hypothetical protein
MMSEIAIYTDFSGTYTGKACTEVGREAKACIGGSITNRKEDNTSITGREIFGSLEMGSTRLTISDEQQIIDYVNKTDEYGIMKTQSGNTYIVRGENGKTSFFKCEELPKTEGGKYRFEVTENGKSLVVSNAKGATKTCQRSTTHG